MEWEVWLPNATTPVIFTDVSAMQAYLAALDAGTTVVVKRFHRTLYDTQVYGLPGGQPLPSPPPTPPATQSVQMQHVLVSQPAQQQASGS